ncbi:bifunctional DNA primase/polymerase [Nocardia sp. NPDC088792]|uniref:bifunctional DNA primase/polymerase n=1 Tax=Nocardia sp. NPDC088792 TaxID=3364332 RepID=UPI003819C63E
MSTNRFRDAALAAAARGWMVFPLRAGSKRPAIDAWPDQATTDRDRITAWWAAHPGANVAIATGPSGLHVLDLDTRHGHNGADTLYQLAADAAARASLLTFTVSTPSNGHHLYYRVPDSIQLPNTASRLGAGIDSRGHGGYVVAPGSQIGPGSYRIVTARPPAMLPDWLLERLALQPFSAPHVASSPPHSPDAYLNAIVAAETHKVSTAEPGLRNTTLFQASFTLGRLIAGGELDQQPVRDALIAAAQEHIGIQHFTTREMERTITSGLTLGARKPRRLPRRH